MASYPPGQCCIQGFRHEGEATGQIITFGPENVQAYVATAAPDKVRNGSGILFVPDIFGLWQNTKLVADQFAAEGYTTFVVDVFKGDPLPYPPPMDLNFRKWIEEGDDGKPPHNSAVIDPIILDAVRALKERYGVTKVGAVGYCFGAKYVVRHLNKTSGIDSGFFAHPSFVTQDELAGVQGPLSIAAAEVDQQFPPDLRHLSEEILQKIGLPYQINLYSGVSHGFAIRADISQPQQKWAKEQAHAQAVAWFDHTLQLSSEKL
ncbi:alpha/beta-hydrolase [Sodiomyces alkalinus F11]|uniref:Alpha/beta-hydrolase n=1 Tax=Sodiomyces alkalinus (strain CBS 110278 / VKM F-3762 / F11) TaxID=1314773 RepID=A0A3N2QAQ0_SODAK|nr:alpha/beta-hydrolase [Sodiomyces alkalinus F11]ROT43833.1 alpha/beta-hydrolase [Sodiomyces alkalinus F11]